jgi:hypothetical protein
LSLSSHHDARAWGWIFLWYRPGKRVKGRMGRWMVGGGRAVGRVVDFLLILLGMVVELCRWVWWVVWPTGEIWQWMCRFLVTYVLNVYPLRTPYEFEPVWIEWSVREEWMAWLGEL